jgi:hypothetical protein
MRLNKDRSDVNTHISHSKYRIDRIQVIYPPHKSFSTVHSGFITLSSSSP